MMEAASARVFEAVLKTGVAGKRRFCWRVSMGNKRRPCVMAS
jgi:hypothetical protein